ncbi:hypothetical protein ACEWY4_015468 [Coilia grayii]|uniref:Ras and EF-hand domain-containing protein-like n=1 Tax=Coilia grayii TaxID=363190 RepID=A0ABD1JP16_9TELE
MRSGQMTDMVFLQQWVFVKPEEASEHGDCFEKLQLTTCIALMMNMYQRDLADSRAEVNALRQENEHLRIGLLNAQTEVTLIQTQLDKLKQEFMADGFSDSELELEPLSCENVDKSDGKGPQESDQDTTGKNGSLYHLVLAGDVGSGKSSFLLHLSQHKFKDDMRSTVGVDCEIKHMLVDGKRMVLQIWDTAGQERFRSISRSYFRKAHGILLLYDITSKKSFSNITQWLEQIEVCTDKSVPMCLVGNKADLREDVPEEQCVSWACGMRLAKACGALFLETSAKDGTNVVEAVLHLAREVKKGGGALTDSTLQLSSVRDQDPAAGKCCWALS